LRAEDPGIVDRIKPLIVRLAMGLVNRVVAGADELAATEAEFTAKLAALDPVAVRLTKETRRAAANMPLADALTMGKQLNIDSVPVFFINGRRMNPPPQTKAQDFFAAIDKALADMKNE